MTRISLIDIAHRLIAETLLPGDTAIDATVGNGHDTRFLAECVGEAGKVYGFDIQQIALDSTWQRLLKHDLAARVTLHRVGHERMHEQLPLTAAGTIKAVMFNLGYLPGADKNLITQCRTTLAALSVAADWLSIDGVMTVMAYPGHPGGDSEAEAIEGWCEKLDQSVFQYRIVCANTPNPRAPRLFVIRKPGRSAIMAGFFSPTKTIK